MSKENHTPEPWRIHQTQDRYSIFENCCLVASMSAAFTEQTTYANAQRIVACVNAMKGIEDPAKYVTDNNDLKELLKTLVEVSKNTETISTKSIVFEALVYAMQKHEK